MVRIQELGGSAKFAADLTERFITGEETNIRVNYGYTCKREFDMPLKTQELNYEDIPVVEGRRVPDSDEAYRHPNRRVIYARARLFRQIRGKRGCGRPRNRKIGPYTAWRV